jgi:hypothetical protein
MNLLMLGWGRENLEMCVAVAMKCPGDTENLSNARLRVREIQTRFVETMTGAIFTRLTLKRNLA